jgi:hypothetical protein
MVREGGPDAVDDRALRLVIGAPDEFTGEAQEDIHSRRRDATKIPLQPNGARVF